MENRSFDHFLGWTAGRRRQAGRAQLPRPLSASPTTPTTSRRSPAAASRTPTTATRAAGSSSNGGKCNGWLRSGLNDSLSIGYFEQTDLQFLGQRGAGLDDLRPLLRGGHGRDVPEPLLHALRADRPAPQQRRPDRYAVQAHRRIWDRLKAKGVSGKYYYSDVPFTFLMQSHAPPTPRSVIRWRRSPAPSSATRPAARCPRSATSTRASSTRTAACPTTTIPHADIRAGEVFMNDVYDAVRNGPGWAEHRPGDHVRRVGRLLRPRAARGMPTTSPTEDQPAGLPGADGRDLAVRAAGVSSPTRPSTTPRS